MFPGRDEECNIIFTPQLDWLRTSFRPVLTFICKSDNIFKLLISFFSYHASSITISSVRPAALRSLSKIGFDKK